MLKTESIKVADALIKNDPLKNKIIDFDLSPGRDNLAVLFENSCVFIYNFNEECIFFHMRLTILGWIKALYYRNQESAHKILYSPNSAGKIIVCSNCGIVIWNSKGSGNPDISERNWFLENTFLGTYTSMDISTDGKFLALGSIYSSKIEIYDMCTQKTHKLSGMHSTTQNLKFSPDNHYLIVTNTENKFRIYETNKFTCESFINLDSPISDFIISPSLKTPIFYSTYGKSLSIYGVEKNLSEKNEYNFCPILFDFNFTNSTDPYIFFPTFKKNSLWYIKNVEISKKGTRMAILYNKYKNLDQNKENVSFLNDQIVTFICLFKVNDQNISEITFTPMYFI